MRPTADPIFEFGNFILVPKERLLLCDGKPVSLTPKAFDLLAVLVRRAGHLVSKDDLLREVWPDTVVEEVNLTVNISALRKVLDRGGNANEIIQTVPKNGYRFIAPVVARDGIMARALPENPVPEVHDPAPSSAPGAPPGSMQRVLEFKRPSWSLVLVALVGIVVVGALIALRSFPYKTETSPVSVAVLPFGTDEAVTRYLADGLTEAAINGLVRLRACVSCRGLAHFITGRFAQRTRGVNWAPRWW